MTAYFLLLLDAAGVVRNTIPFTQETDEGALAYALALLEPGHTGEVWQSTRRVGAVHPPGTYAVKR
jgi:hypothetical protein